MTLKEFAEKNGIGYNLAKQWRNRGKIVTEGDGYRLVTPVTVTPVTVTRLGVTESEVTDLPVTPALGIGVTDCPPVTSQSVTAESCSGCETNAREIASLRLALASLSGDCRTLRDRVADLEAARESGKQLRSLPPLTAKLMARSNYAGSAKNVGEPFDDLATAEWNQEQ